MAIARASGGRVWVRAPTPDGSADPDAMRRSGAIALLATRAVIIVAGRRPAQPVQLELLGEVFGVHVGVLGGRGELAAMRLEHAGDVGALELLHDARLGIAE